MRALTYQGPESLTLDTVPDPTLLHPTDAIVRVDAAGVCGSDLHVYHGRETGLDRGTVMGHELAGVVVEVGSAVTSYRPGDQVTSPFTTSCGDCFYCRTGLTARCERGELFGWVEDGAGLHGVQAEYARVPLADSTLVAVPEGVAPELALLAGDVLATGFFGAEQAGASPGATVAVVGCGPVGLCAVLAARELGAERVLAVDPVAERRALAERFGAEPVDLEAASPAVLEATEGRGADAVVEAVGSPAATRTAFDLARPGGTLAAVGVHHEAHLAVSPVEAYDRNLTYRAGRCPARRYSERLLALIAAGAWPLGELISHRLPLTEGAEAYAMFTQRRDGCTKVVLRAAGAVS